MRRFASALLFGTFLALAACGKSESPAPPASVPLPPPVVAVDGKALFEKNCAACHGPKGLGDGPAASALPNKPANLGLDKTQKKSDAELAGAVSNGTDKGMSPWKNVLKDEEIKAIVKYIRELKK